VEYPPYKRENTQYFRIQALNILNTGNFPVVWKRGLFHALPHREAGAEPISGLVTEPIIGPNEPIICPNEPIISKNEPIIFR
jgi:hypothetical protein